MTEASAPVPVDAVRRAATSPPQFATVAEAEEYGRLLSDHVQLLIPNARTARDQLPKGARSGADRVIAWADAVLERDCGGTLDEVAWHVENLATACRLLLNLVTPPHCVRCGTAREGDDVRLSCVVETGSGAGGFLHVCRNCRTREWPRPGG